MEIYYAIMAFAGVFALFTNQIIVSAAIFLVLAGSFL